jgi:hypothetical protein
MLPVVVVVVLAAIIPPPLLVAEIGEIVLSALKANETCEAELLDVPSFLHDTITMLTIITGRKIIKIVFFIFSGFGFISA